MLVVGFILRHKLIFTGLLVLFGLLFYYILYTMPNAQAVAYVAKMQPGVTSIKQLFNHVSETTGSSLFIDPDIPASEKQAQLVLIANNNQRATVALNNLRGDAEQLGAPIVFPSSEYSQASEMREKLLPVIGQSQEVLRDYSALTEFLAYYYQVQEGLRPTLEQNAALSADFKARIRQESQKLASFQLPVEFDDVQNKIVQNLNELAESNQVTVAARMNNQALGYELFSVVAAPSQTVKNAAELPEKLQSNNL